MATSATLKPHESRNRARWVEPIFLLVMTLLLTGCTAHGPVSHISIMRAFSNEIPAGVPSFVTRYDPYPTETQRVFQPGQEMYVIIQIDTRVSGEITFSRFTFFNLDTGQETDIGSSGNLRHWEPGQTDLLNPGNPWPVPDDEGNYRVRVYQDDKIVASAVFQVMN